MIVERKKLNFWERLYIPAVLGGFKVTALRRREEE